MNTKIVLHGKTVLGLCVLLAIVFMTLSCAGDKKPLLTPYEFDKYSSPPMPRLAILPLENFSPSERASKKVSDIFLVEFLKMKNIYLIEPGNIEIALADERIRNTSIMPMKTVKVLADRLNADLIMIGSILEFEMQQSRGGTGTVPMLSLTLRILDARTGNIVWAANVNSRGDDKEKLFGIGKIHSLDKLVETTAKEIVYEFSRFIKDHAE